MFTEKGGGGEGAHVIQYVKYVIGAFTICTTIVIFSDVKVHVVFRCFVNEQYCILITV